MLLGVELVTDRQLKTPAPTETLHAMDQMKGKISKPSGSSHIFLLSYLMYKLLLLPQN